MAIYGATYNMFVEIARKEWDEEIKGGRIFLKYKYLDELVCEWVDPNYDQEAISYPDSNCFVLFEDAIADHSAFHTLVTNMFACAFDEHELNSTGAKRA
jgi:hypothetical protein